MRKRVCHLYEERVADRRDGEDPSLIAAPEAGLQRCGIRLCPDIVGMQENPPVGIAHLIGQIFVGCAWIERGHLVGPCRSVPAEIVVHDERSEAFGGFLQRAVENLVELGAHHMDGEPDRDCPENRE